MIADLYGWLLDVYPGRGGAVVWLLGEDGGTIAELSKSEASYHGIQYLPDGRRVLLAFQDHAGPVHARDPGREHDMRPGR